MSAPETSTPEAMTLCPQKSRRTKVAAAASTDAAPAAGAAAGAGAGSAAGEDSGAPTVEYTKHALKEQWSMWALCTVKGKKSAQNSVVFDFDTVEDFWSIFNSLQLPSKISTKTNIIFLRRGVKPEWEDPFNKDGGEWIADFETRGPKDKLDLLWEHTLLAILGGQVFDSDNIAGVWLQIRPRFTDKVLIWTRSAKEEHAQKAGAAWIQLAKEHAGIDALPCGFIAHADSVTQANSKGQQYEVKTRFAHNNFRAGNKK